MTSTVGQLFVGHLSGAQKTKSKVCSIVSKPMTCQNIATPVQKIVRTIDRKTDACMTKFH